MESSSPAPRRAGADGGVELEVVVTEDGGAVSGECEIWALEEGAFDPRALLMVGRATGDRVETSRRVATWSGRTVDGRASVLRAAGASALVMARRGASYGEVEVPATARFMPLALGLILSGAVGNAIDRVHKQAVTDFLRVYTDHPAARRWLLENLGTAEYPSFNIADIAISVGVVMFLFAEVFLRPKTAPVGPENAPTP